MEDQSKKRTVVLFGLIAIVILSLVGIIALAFFSERSSTTIKQQPINISSGNASAKKQNQQGVPDTSWVEGQGQTYTVLYPSDWQVEVASVSGGGTAATFQKAGSEFPRFYVEAAASESATSITDRLQTLAWMHLPESTAHLVGATGTELSGTVPMNPLPDSANQSQIHKTYLFFEKNGTQYVITESYFEDKNAAANKKLLDTILVSLKFE